MIDGNMIKSLHASPSPGLEVASASMPVSPSNVSPALYGAGMANAGDLKVSRRGEMSLPAAVRRRWGLQDGGEVAYLDLGDAVVLVRGDIAGLRRRLLESVGEDDWAAARSGFGDADLATE